MRLSKHRREERLGVVFVFYGLRSASYQCVYFTDDRRKCLVNVNNEFPNTIFVDSLKSIDQTACGV